MYSGQPVSLVYMVSSIVSTNNVTISHNVLLFTIKLDLFERDICLLIIHTFKIFQSHCFAIKNSIAVKILTSPRLM